MALVFFGLLPCAFAHQADANKQRASESSPAQTNLTIKTQVRQVILDVVVTDRKHRAVHGLSQQDFTVFEDGKPQRIVSFNEHVETTTASLAVPVAEEPLPPNTFVNTPRTDENLPLIVVLFDLMNTPLIDQSFGHAQMVKFLRKRPPRARIAIFVLSNRLYLLQGFTDDERLLLAAANRKDASGHVSLADQHQTGTNALDAAANGANFAGDDATARNAILNMKEMEAQYDAHLVARRADATIAAFGEIAHFLSGLPGRKNLVWLSGSFPAEIFPTPTASFSGTAYSNPLPTSAPSTTSEMQASEPGTSSIPTLSFSSPMREAADMLAAARVAVYPVDIRGLTTDPAFTAAFGGTFRMPYDQIGTHMGWLQSLWATQAVMEEIADDTGGHAYINGNGLAKDIAASIEEGANYYTLTYAPSDTKFDGRLRRIHVKLAGEGHHLAYRRSYLADDVVVSQAALESDVMEHLQVALRRGAPLVHELEMQVHVAPQGSPRKAKSGEITQLAKFPAYAGVKKWNAVKIQRYLIDYTFWKGLASVENGNDNPRAGKLEFLFAAYDKEDRTMFGQRTPVERKYSKKDWEAIQKGANYHVRQVLEIPADTSWLRLAVRDDVGGRVGSVEIPLPVQPMTLPKNDRP